MARQLVVLALIFIAIVGCVSAVEAPAKAPSVIPGTSKNATSPTVHQASTPNASAHAPSDSGADASKPGALSPTDNSSSSVGGPSVGDDDASAPEPSAHKSSASALGFSTVTGVAALAGYFFFF